jgi:hypothetical protein
MGDAFACGRAVLCSPTFPGATPERGPNQEMIVSTEAELQAELERLKAENAALKARGSKGVSMKVSEKGAVSVYGLGRFPVTLYQEQWLKLLDLSDDIRTFIKENEGRLKKKE